MADDVPENIDPQEPPSGPQQEPSEERVNVWNPEGELKSMPSSMVDDLVNSGEGYSLASPEDTQNYHLQQRRATPSQEALTALEGVATPISFGTFPALEKATGLTTGKDILERRQANPGYLYSGEALPFVAAAIATAVTGGAAAPTLAPMFGGVGAIGAAEAGVGTAATSLLGEGAIGTMGSLGLRGIIGNGLFTATDEIDKMVADGHKPSADAIETAATNVALSSVFGGTLGVGAGAISPLWRATVGPQVTKVMGALSSRLGGKAADIAEPAASAMTNAGVEMAPEARALLSKDPEIQRTAQYLQESQSKSGLEAQEAFKNAKKSMGDSISSSFNKTTEDIQPIHEISKSDVGSDLGNSLSKEVEARRGPLGEKFDELQKRYENVELPKDEEINDPNNPYVKKTVPGSTSVITDQLLGLAREENWDRLHDGRFMGIVNSAIKSLPEQATLRDLNELASAIGKETYDKFDPAKSRAGQLVAGVLSDHATNIAFKKLGVDAPNLIEPFAAARSEYANLGKITRQLDGALHTGSSNPSNFVKFLKNMASERGEDVLNRLSGKNRASVLELLQKEFPETASKLRDYHINNLLGSSLENGLEKSINTTKFFRNLNKMSPELRDFAVPSEAAGKLKAIDQINNSFPIRMNPSGTAKTLQMMIDKVPATAGSFAGSLLNMFPGGRFVNTAIGYLLGSLGKMMGRDAPDAVRLALLRFMMSDKPINAPALKAAVDFIHNVSKGNKLIDTSVKALFDSSKVLPSAVISQKKESIEKLDEMLKKLQDAPAKMASQDDDLMHYMPYHGSSASLFKNNAAKYLNDMRPQANKANPLDNDPVIPVGQKKAYERQLQIANQPLSVFQYMKEGTLTAQDVMTVKAVYPNLYQRLGQKITDEMIGSLAGGKQIPYKTRLNLGLFMGQPLDSTMTPEGIQLKQAALANAPAPLQGQKVPRQKGAINNLSKMADSEMTSGQRAESRRLK